MWTREGQNMFELRISDSSSSIIFDQCSHRYSRSGYSQMSTNKNLYWTVLLAKILTTCKISLSFFILISAIFLIAIDQSRVSKRSLYQTVPSTIEWFRPSLLVWQESFYLGLFSTLFQLLTFCPVEHFWTDEKNGMMCGGMDAWGDKTDLKFVKNFTRPDFCAKNFTH